jgi:hypothetical protein
MSSFPPTHLAQINQAIQKGRGAAASVLGQTYDVYRLGSQSGQIVSGTPLYMNYPATLTHWKNLKDIENQVFDALTFAATCDNTFLEVGDVFVGTGYGSDGAMYVVGDMRPLKHTILIRCEQSATITRPTTAASNATLNTGKPTQIKSYVGVTKTTEQSLILTNGSYSFSATGSSAMVPFGLQPLNKLREMPESKLPTDTKRESFVGFLPLLPGVILEENDVISSGASGDRFRIEQNYIAEHGLQGQVLLLQKLTV